MERQSLPWWVPVVAAASLGAAGTYISDCGHNDREIVQRLSALESHREGDGKRHEDESRRLDRIEAKLDDLVKWALGK